MNIFIYILFVYISALKYELAEINLTIRKPSVLSRDCVKVFRSSQSLLLFLLSQLQTRESGLTTTA